MKDVPTAALIELATPLVTLQSSVAIPVTYFDAEMSTERGVVALSPGVVLNVNTGATGS